MDDATVQELHHRATLGGKLSDSDQARLDAWYEQQDAEEATELAPAGSASPPLESLRAEVSEALTQLQKVTARIQAQSDINETLRQEVIELSRRLTSAPVSRSL